MGFIKDFFIKDKVEDTMPARCGVTKEEFDILLGSSNGRLTMIGSKRSEYSTSDRSGNSKGMKVIDLTNGLDTSRTFLLYETAILATEIDVLQIIGLLTVYLTQTELITMSSMFRYGSLNFVRKIFILCLPELVW